MEKCYLEDECLLLSGIQHMAFCERQWALIHIEQAWAENVLTLDGRYLHERTDDPFEDETRKDIRTVMAMPIISKKLGLRGVADVVEFQRTNNEIEGVTICLKNRKGWWKTTPVEYKRGRPKRDDRDAVQLGAQAMALEEMLDVKIDSGFLYYGQLRRREYITIDQTLRERVKKLSAKMHEMMVAGKTPKAMKDKHCSLCSLKEICQPKLTTRNRSVEKYIARMANTGVGDY